MTEEHKQKIKEGRERARKEKLANGIPLKQRKEKKKDTGAEYVNDKLVLHITGNEKTSYDFWNPFKFLLRPLGKYDMIKMLQKELAHPVYWNNVSWLKETLSKYFHIVEDVPDTKKKKEKKERKKSTYVMTEEHKAKLQAAREQRKEKK